MSASLQRYLEDQQSLTAVDRFADAHERGTVPSQERYYRDLIPTETPRDGEQYAFEVDLDACTGCKACVTGCHNRNGLDAAETWRQVGTIPSGSAGLDFPMTVTTACHHCAEPGCLEGCPVLAYEKDPETGIVRHLDDQCIGCQYCVMKCPYDVPQFDDTRGIVRKCDMCIDRLDVGEAPACVQSCPNEAIRIVVSSDTSVEAAARNFAPIPEVADVVYTRPTTIYKTTRRVDTALGLEDYEEPEPEHAHLSLVVMLVLTQASVGVLAAALLAQLLGAPSPLLAVAAAVMTLAGMAASVFHLGRPLYGFRAILGIRTSWLSREIVALGAYAPAVCAYAALTAFPRTGEALTGIGVPGFLITPAGPAALALGIVAIGCSSMVYVDTPRPVWANARTPAKFGLTAAIALGFAALVAATTGAAPLMLSLPVALAAAGAKAFVEFDIVARADLKESKLWRRTAALMLGPLRGAVAVRLGSLTLAVLAALAATISGVSATSVALAGTAFLLALLGEFAERYLFFAACDAPRMPGIPRRHHEVRGH